VNEKGEPLDNIGVTVEGETGDKAEDVVAAYKTVMDELSEEEN